MSRITLWASIPPPVGGVTRSNQLIRDLLVDRGEGVRCLGPTSILRRPVAAVLALTSKWHVIAVSRPIRILPLALLLLLRGQRVAILIHGLTGIRETVDAGRLTRPMITGLLRRAGRVWVNNTEGASALASVGVASTVVSPWPVPLHARTPRPRGDVAGELRVTTAEFRSKGHVYNVATVLEALETVESSGRPTHLTLLRYGDGPTPTGQSTPVSGRVLEDSTLEEVRAVLLDTDVFIRATNVDGDSGIVREALEAGCRVIATDVVPRPAGVELFSLAAGSEHLAKVLVAGGPVSDGSGLGAPIESVLDEFLVGRRP